MRVSRFTISPSCTWIFFTFPRILKRSCCSLARVTAPSALIALVMSRRSTFTISPTIFFSPALPRETVGHTQEETLTLLFIHPTGWQLDLYPTFPCDFHHRPSLRELFTELFSRQAKLFGNSSTIGMPLRRRSIVHAAFPGERSEEQDRHHQGCHDAGNKRKTLQHCPIVQHPGRH